MSEHLASDGFHPHDITTFSKEFGLSVPKNNVISHPVHWGGIGREIQTASLQRVESSTIFELTFTISDMESLSSLYARLPNGWSMFRNQLYTIFNPGKLHATIDHVLDMLDIPPVHNEKLNLTFTNTVE